MAQYELNLRDYWQIVRKQRRLIVLMAVLVGGAAFGLSHLLKPEPLYEATAMVRYERSSNVSGLFLDVVAFSFTDSVASQTEVIKSYPVIAAAAKMAGLIPPETDSETIRLDPELLQVVLNLQSRVEAEREGNTNIIRIKVTSSRAEQAERLADSVVTAYQQQSILTRNRQVTEATEFIKAQLTIVEGQLHEAEQALKSFQKTEGIIELKAEVRAALTERVNVESQHADVLRTLAEIDEQIARLQGESVVRSDREQRATGAALSDAMKEPKRPTALGEASSDRATEITIPDLRQSGNLHGHPVWENAAPISSMARRAVLPAQFDRSSSPEPAMGVARPVAQQAAQASGEEQNDLKTMSRGGDEHDQQTTVPDDDAGTLSDTTVTAEAIVPLIDDQPDSLLFKLNTLLKRMVDELNGLAVTHVRDHPQIQELREKIDKIQAQILSVLIQRRDAVHGQEQELAGQLRVLQAASDRVTNQIVHLVRVNDHSDKEVGELKREAGSLLVRRGQLEAEHASVLGQREKLNLQIGQFRGQLDRKDDLRERHESVGESGLEEGSLQVLSVVPQIRQPVQEQLSVNGTIEERVTAVDPGHDGILPLPTTGHASASGGAIAEPESTEWATRVTSIEFSSGSLPLEVTIHGNGRLNQEIMLLNGPRLVVDLPGTTAALTAPQIPTGQPLLKGIRIGQHQEPKKVRVVFDLAEPATYRVRDEHQALVVTLIANSRSSDLARRGQDEPTVAVSLHDRESMRAERENRAAEPFAPAPRSDRGEGDSGVLGLFGARADSEDSLARLELSASEKRDQTLPSAHQPVSRIFTEDSATQVFMLNTWLMELQRERDKRLITYWPDHPLVQELDEEIGVVREELLRELDAKRSTYQSRQQQLERQLREIEAQSSNIPDQALQLVRLQREVEINGGIFSLLRTRHQEAMIKGAEKIVEVAPIQPAFANTTPMNAPRTALNVVVGTVVGGLLGLLIGFVRESFDTSLGTIEDVEAFLGLPVLGVLPQISYEVSQQVPVALSGQKVPSDRIGEGRARRWFQWWGRRDLHWSEQRDPRRADRRSVWRLGRRVQGWRDRRDPARGDRRSKPEVALASLYAPNSALAESYRSLRTNLLFTALGHPLQSVQLTSVGLGEGKTSVVVNLAVSMAQAGKRVLVIDADLRRPAIHKVFGIGKSPGLTELLLGNKTFEQVCRSLPDLLMGRFRVDEVLSFSGIDKLNIVTSGFLPRNPSECINSARFDALVGQLKQEYDLIIFDTPPILPVADSVIIGRKTDGTLLVYQVGDVPRVALRRAKLILEQAQVRVLGTVLNNVRPEVTTDSYPLHYCYPYVSAETDDPVEELNELDNLDKVDK